MVRTRLRNPFLDVAMNDNEALIGAARNGHEKIVKMLLKDGRCDPSARENASLMYALQNKHIGMAASLLDSRRLSPARMSEALRLAAGLSLGLVRTLIENYHVHPSIDDNEALAIACSKGQYDVFNYLLSFEEVDPCARSHRYSILLDSVRKRHYQIFYRLIAHPRINSESLSDALGLCLVSAAGNKSCDVVSTILKDQRFHSYQYLADAFTSAASSDCLDVVKMLLEDPRFVDDLQQKAIPTAIRSAIQSTKMVQFLLEIDRNIDISHLLAAVNANAVETVRILLDCGQIDPSESNNQAAVNACGCFAADILRMLLEDERVSLSLRLDEAVKKAINSLSNAPLRLLMTRFPEISDKLLDYVKITLSVGSRPCHASTLIAFSSDFEKSLGALKLVYELDNQTRVLNVISDTVIACIQSSNHRLFHHLATDFRTPSSAFATNRSLEAAIHQGDLDTMKVILKAMPEVSRGIVIMACAVGNLEALKLVWNRTEPLLESQIYECMCWAIKANSIPMVSFLLSSSSDESLLHQCRRRAKKAGKSDIVAFLQNQRS